MAAKGKKAAVTTEAPTAARYDELKRMLVERQREIMNEVQGKIRDVRADGADKDHEVLDPGETSEVDIQEDIEFALIQMKAETSTRSTKRWRASKRARTPLLRVRRGDRAAAAPRAAVRSAMQGLRGGP